MSDDWILAGAVRDQPMVSVDWEPVGQRLIEGVRLKETKNVPRGTGQLTEIWRTDWLLDGGAVNHAFQNSLEPGTISAWHVHGEAIDRLFVVQGQLIIALYDARPDSPTLGLVNEFRMSAARPTLISIPPKVWHGVANRTGSLGTLINLSDREYNYSGPDHWRLPADTPEIPYKLQ